jgi:hypothetical protein
MATIRGGNADDANFATSYESTAPPNIEKTTVIGVHSPYQQTTSSTDVEGQVAPAAAEDDAFGNEEGAEIQYKTCKWWYVLIPHTPQHVSVEHREMARHCTPSTKGAILSAAAVYNDYFEYR